jgi:hypothetical protein
MILREFFKQTLIEGGNLEIDGAQAQHIDLKVHNRAYITPILNSLLHSINNGFQDKRMGSGVALLILLADIAALMTY